MNDTMKIRQAALNGLLWRDADSGDKPPFALRCDGKSVTDWKPVQQAVFKMRGATQQMEIRLKALAPGQDYQLRWFNTRQDSTLRADSPLTVRLTTPYSAELIEYAMVNSPEYRSAPCPESPE